MATTVIPLLNLRHNGPRGVGAPTLVHLRRFQSAPLDLVTQESKKVAGERKKLVAGLRNDLDVGGTVGVQAKLQKIKAADKRAKELDALLKADASKDKVCTSCARCC